MMPKKNAQDRQHALQELRKRKLEQGLRPVPCPTCDTEAWQQPTMLVVRGGVEEWRRVVDCHACGRHQEVVQAPVGDTSGHSGLVESGELTMECEEAVTVTEAPTPENTGGCPICGSPVNPGRNYCSRRCSNSRPRGPRASRGDSAGRRRHRRRESGSVGDDSTSVLVRVPSMPDPPREKELNLRDALVLDTIEALKRVPQGWRQPLVDLVNAMDPAQ